jgi:hypothetical protein
VEGFHSPLLLCIKLDCWVHYPADATSSQTVHTNAGRASTCFSHQTQQPAMVLHG